MLLQSSDPVEPHKRFHHSLQLPRIGMEVLGQLGQIGSVGRACPALAQVADHREGKLEIPAGSGGSEIPSGDQAREAGHEHSAEQHDDPGNVDPQQQQRQRCKGAVDRRIRTHVQHVDREQVPRTGQHEAGENTPHQRMPPAHASVGHKVVERCKSSHSDPRFQQVENPAQWAGGVVDAATEKRHQCFHQHHAGSEDQRAERDGRPVEEDALSPRPLPADLPDGIERVVDGVDQRDGRIDQRREANHSELARLGAELIQIAHHLPGDTIRNQALH